MSESHCAPADEAVRISLHADSRARQRGFRRSDIDLILTFGTPTDDGTVLTRRDAQRSVEALKRQIADLERLSGAAVVTDGPSVITLYHARAGRTRHLLRRAGRHCRHT